MIKKLVLGFGLLILSLVGLRASAVGVFTTVGIDSFNSPVNSNYSITALKGGGFLSNYLGVGKSVLALDNQRLFWWTTNGYPYAYLKSSNGFVGTEEGFFDRYYACDLMTGAGIPTNCTYTTIDYSGGTAEFDKTVFKSFFNSVVQGDNFYTQSEDYRYVGATWNYSLNYVRVCWNSEELGKSFCFMGGRCSPGEGSSYCQSLGGLVNSQHLKDQFSNGLTFGLLSNNWIGYAPGQLGYDGGQTEIPDGSLQNISCPTIQQVINNYNSKGFYSGLCYTFGKIYNGSSFEDVPVQSIFDVFSGKDDYLNWYQGYVTYCKSSVYNPVVCSDYFSGNSLKYNIFAKIPDISMVGGGKLLYNYCELYNYDLNATTCVASGVTPDMGTEITNDDVGASLGMGEYTVFSPVTNNSEYNTVFNMGSGYEYSGDIITNIQQLFGKFTSLFKQQTGNTSGILPLWILIPFIIIVLFKLFKK